MTNISDKRDQETLRWRALELARSSHETTAPQDRETFLEFRVVGMRYAIHLNQIDTVRKVDEVFPIPRMPSYITGVIRRRGRPVVLISLGLFFYPSMRGIRDADYAVVVLAKNKRFALQVEEIEGVRQFEKSGFLPAVDHIASEQLPFISSVTTDGLAVIDLDKLVQADGLVLS